MGLTFEEAQALFRAGRFGEIASSLPTKDRLQTLRPEQRLLFARALVHSSRSEAALAMIEAENGPDASPAVRATCEFLLGSMARNNAALTSSRNHYESALHFARTAKEHVIAGWAAIQLLRLVAEVQPDTAVATMLSDVRRQVLHTGDPQLVSYMHNTVAMLEASSGRLTEAKRHLMLADALLADHPHAWLEQSNWMARYFVCFHECNYDKALSALERARALLNTAGGQQQPVIEANYGYTLGIVGRFAAAIATLQSLANDTSRGLSRLSAVDGLAAVFLATGQIDDCEEALASLEQSISADPMLATAYWMRWTAATRVKLLLAKGRYKEAFKQAELFEEQGIVTNDPILSFHVQCLKAEAAALCGKGDEASRILFSCANAQQDLTPDQVAAFYRALGRALEASPNTLCCPILQRASAIWSEYGNVSARRELGPLEQIENGTPTSPNDTAAQVVTSLAAAFRFSGNAALFGRELLQAIDVLKCNANARISKQHVGERKKGNGAEGAYAIGLVAGTALTLRCDVPPNPRDAILLADVLRIGRAAVELERYRQEERNRAALWPADPIETEQGALFLAEETQALLATARRIAPTNVPVLITGETGTGKEVLARLIHAYSNRAKATFLPFNCSAIPKDMLDAQLFGHRRGAFTGATDNFQGVIRAAGGGTLLLDEIGETTLDVQPKLLRFLESGEIHPIGEAHPTKVDVRIIAATNADLDTLVAQGRFRDDLFYRLNIVRLHVPPLRERRVEIPALANHYLRKYAKENAKGDLRLAEETMEYLVLFRWPGNVRQLANEMRRMAALAESGAVLMPEHLSADIFASRKTIPASERTLEPTELVVRLDQPMAAAVQHVERAMIIYAMKKCGGAMEETASLLGLSRKGLYLKRQRYDIETPGETAAAVA